MDEAATPAEAHDVLGRALTALQDLLGEDWEVSLQSEHQSEQFMPAPTADLGWDAVVRITSKHDSMFTELLVDVRGSVTPRDVAGYISSTALLVRRVNAYTRLVIFSPWISPRTQEELRRREIGYVDLTGNISLRVPRPAIIIQTQGADRAPARHRAPSSKPLLTGPRAGRLVRILTDVSPPYRATELAKRSDLSLPYVSRLLDTLEDQLLIERDGKVIVRVEWQQLLRTRASHLDLMKQTSPQGMLAPNGVQAVLDRLVKLNGLVAGGEVLVTGSYAARPVAPVAVGGQLMLYVTQDPLHFSDVAHELRVMPVPESADVLFLQPSDLSVVQRPRRYDRYRQVGLSQLVLDCLSGPGRLPAEGEKVLEFMAAEERAWRIPDISRLRHQDDLDAFPGAADSSLF
ncbi:MULTISPECIES: helix-turn-helix domain-containing protein [unclassified Streptomyces]|uniref:helix-turn-helix domain-containing protein n=1 Tax=unclassified Streptomyces TaxID=2593676 RepID=UPI003320B708